MDFGIAANILRDTSVTGSTSVMGTPKYMSPEQHRRQPLTPQSDLYSLGCVFYEMLTGKPPFTGDDASAMAQAHQREPIPLLPVKLRHYQPLLRQLLAKSPADRPQSGTAITELLDNLESPEHYTRERARYRPQETGINSALAPRLRLKETKAGMSWRGNLYQYDIYLVADDFEQFQSHFPVLRSALQDWHQQRGSRCKSVTIKATLHPWISGRVKQYLKELRQSDDLAFLGRLPMQLNLVAADGQPIERLAWEPESESG